MCKDHLQVRKEQARESADGSFGDGSGTSLCDKTITRFHPFVHVPDESLDVHSDPFWPIHGVQFLLGLLVVPTHNDHLVLRLVTVPTASEIFPQGGSNIDNPTHAVSTTNNKNRGDVIDAQIGTNGVPIIFGVGFGVAFLGPESLSNGKTVLNNL